MVIAASTSPLVLSTHHLWATASDNPSFTSRSVCMFCWLITGATKAAGVVD